MDQGQKRPLTAAASAPAASGIGALPGNSFPMLLGDFPDPVLVADGEKRVVFLNNAARKFFGKTLRPGDPCPICSLIQGQKIGGEIEGRLGRCLAPGESLNRMPALLKGRFAAPVPFTVSASPIGGSGDRPAGCLVILRDWHEDLLAHPELQLQTATLTSILENYPNPFFTVDPDLVITHINKHMEQFTGYKQKEAVGKLTCGALLNTAYCNTENCVLRQVMKTRKPTSGFRTMIKDRKGREIQVVVSASIITDVAGRVIGGFEVIRDITPIVNAEKKIELLTELTQEGIIMVDENQKILFANSKMADIVRQPKQKLLGQKLVKILTPQHRQMAMQLTQMVKEGLKEESQFCSTLDRDPETGESRIFETCMAAAPIGKNILTCIYLRDLTNRLRILDQLHKTNIFLNNIIRCSVDGIVVIDTKGNPLIFSEGAERILGFKAGEIVANKAGLRRFYKIELAREMMRRMRSPEYGPPDRLNTTQITFYNAAGQEVPVNFSAAIIRDRHGKEVGSVGIFSDLREHLKLRQELEWSQILQAEKITSLGRLAASVAHEINNPLAGILIYAEILQRELAKEGADQQYIEEIINQTLRCQQIVTRLLEFSRKSLGQVSRFDVNDTIRRCVELICHQAFFHDVEIVRNLDPDLPQILGDAGQIQQVTTNLLLNAADAMDGAGRITISTRPAPEADGVILCFADTGPGIPENLRDKIFEPFFTTKAPGTGTGLGLSIVHGIIQRHGGSIEVACPPGGGTVFTIKLPLECPQNLGGS